MDQLLITLESVFFSVSLFARMLFIFISSFLEGLPIIGSILPGGTVALLIGSLSNKGFISPLVAISIIAFGSFLGDITGFYIGKYFKNTRWLKKIIEHEKHQKKWDVFDRHIALIVIFGKLIPVVRSTPSFFAGARNIKTQKYFLFSFLGSIIWAVVGIYGGQALSRIFGNYAVIIIILILIVSGIITFIVNYRKKKYKLKVSV